jgi:hypothetical protein
MSKRETLAATAYSSTYFDVIHSPSKWIDEIVDSIADPVEFAREVIELHLKFGQRNHAVARVIQEYADAAAARARDGILDHPGPVV